MANKITTIKELERTRIVIDGLSVDELERIITKCAGDIVCIKKECEVLINIKTSRREIDNALNSLSPTTKEEDEKSLLKYDETIDNLANPKSKTLK